MKKIIFNIAFYLIPIFVLSQEGTFDYYKINGNTFDNITYKLGLSADAQKVPAFKIFLPDIEVKNVSLMTSSIIYEIVFRDGGSIYVVGNIPNMDEEQIEQIIFKRNNIVTIIENNSMEDIIYADRCKVWLKDTYPEKGLKIKRNRYNAFVQKNDFMIFCFNIKKEKIDEFTQSLNSFELVMQ